MTKCVCYSSAATELTFSVSQSSSTYLQLQSAAKGFWYPTDCVNRETLDVK